MKILHGTLVAVALACLVGCELNEEKFDDLTFDNASRYTVQVNPRTSEWSGFSLAPGEKKKLNKIDNPDFSWKPEDKVELGVSSTDRYIVFVDRSIAFDENPTIVVITNIVVDENPRR